MTMGRLLMACAALAASATAALAQTAADSLGDWSGALSTPNGALPLVITLKTDDSGALAADLESPAQAPGVLIPATSVAVEDGTLAFAIANLGASYEGEWDAASDTWTGTFSQGGGQLPLTLARGRPDAE